MSFGLPYGVKERNKNGRLRSINTINGERFVYYERLLTDAESGINTIWPEQAKQDYEKAKRVLDWRIDYGSNPQDISAYFGKLASYEFEKERALLETHFKTSYDPTSITCGQHLIEAYNTILSTKEIFERNALLLANTNQAALVTNFPYYLNEALHAWINDPKRDFSAEINELALSSVIEGKDKSDKIAKAIELTINNHSLEIVEDAIMRMFNAGAENGLKKKMGDEEFTKLGQAYKEILSALKDIDNKAKKNEFIEGMKKNYKLDNLGQMITESFKGKRLNKNNIKRSVDKFKFDVETKSKRGILGGGAAEYLGNFLSSIIISNKGVKIDSIHTGKRPVEANQKADMIFMIGFDEGAAEAAEEKLNEFAGTGRGSNVGDIKKFTEEMFRDFGNTKGFMLFINSKNYTPNWHFRNGYFKNGEQIAPGGYSAGSPINLVAWDDMMHQMNIRGRDMIFTIMQLIPGAIGNPNGGNERLEEVSTMFARAISSALFDDFEPDDPYKKKGAGMRTVHLLWLNGVYVPLSVFYSLLAEAFGDLEDSLERDELIKVEFSLPNNILYPTQDDQKGVRHPWDVQSKEALSAITVSYHFLSGFQKFMKRFYDLS